MQEEHKKRSEVIKYKINIEILLLDGVMDFFPLR